MKINIIWRGGLRPRLICTSNAMKSWGNIKKFFGKTVPLPFHTYHHKDAKLSLKWLGVQHQQATS